MASKLINCNHLKQSKWRKSILGNPIHERRSSLLEIMMGAVGDAGPSLGMQDQLNVGIK